MRYFYHEYYIDDESRVRVQTVLESAHEDENNKCLIDILELIQVCYLLQDETGDFLQNKEESQINLKKTISVFFNNLSEAQIQECFSIFNERDDTFPLYDYFDTFSQYFHKFKLHKKFPEKSFGDVLLNTSIPIVYFLKHDCYRTQYKNSLKFYFLRDAQNIKLLIDYCIRENISYKLPQGITSEEYSNMLDKYLQSPSPNVSYLQLMSKGIKKLNNFFTLSPEQMVKAEIISQKLYKDMEQSNQFFKTKQEIIVFKDFSDYSKSTCAFKSLLDLEWLSKYNDPMYLLNYFRAIDWFFVDGNLLGTCSFPNIEMSTMGRMIQTRTLEHYEVGFTFSCKNSLILMTILHYQDLLSNDKNQSIESILNYFYNTYLPENRDVNFLDVSFPNYDYPIQQKTREILIKHELLCKQMKVYLSGESIDIRIINKMNKPNYSEIYIPYPLFYSINEDSSTIKKMCNLLFSDQSLLCFISQGLKADSFYDLVTKNKIKQTDLHHYQINDVMFLAENSVIDIVDEYIVISEPRKFVILLLFNLYTYGSISSNLENYDFLMEKITLSSKEKESLFRSTIHTFLANGYIVENKSLFTKNESDYLEYILSDKHFDNSLGIRNKYVHGNISENEQHEYAYALLISVFTALRLEMFLETEKERLVTSPSIKE